MSIQSTHGLDTHGLAGLAAEHWNLPAERLIEQTLIRGEGMLAHGGPLRVLTGAHTGRSAGDKFIVRDDTTKDTVWWGKVNASITEENFACLAGRMREHYRGREAWVQDLYGGRDPKYRLAARVVTEQPWHSMFAGTMLVRPPPGDLAEFTPEFTILQAPSCLADPQTCGTRTPTFVVVSMKERLALIGGTSYGGEIKKTVFTVLNYLLPQRGVMSMHASANVGPAGDVAVFFGLSGTGKTTLSADSTRTLIGDDEHGWSDTGVFNYEGGCYAKVIALSPTAEPEIHATTRRFGTIIENVVMDEDTRALDLDDAALTENTRAAYPIHFIPNASDTGRADHARNVILLTCDAFGVLPPVSRLTPDQAMYHFISGYTAKVAGTEKGVTEPTATFSACFGAPFMPLHPFTYAKLLAAKMKEHGTDCWLINTGWSGGPHGTGSRIAIGHTRALVHAALEGTLRDARFTPDPVFGVQVPDKCPGVPDEVLSPRSTWADPEAYDKKARQLAKLFQENFAQFADGCSKEVRDAGPRAS